MLVAAPDHWGVSRVAAGQGARARAHMAPPPRGPSSPTKAAPPAAAPAPPSSQEKEVAFLRAQLDVLRAQGAREAQEHSAQLRDVTAKLADAEAVLSHSKRLEVDQKTIITALEASQPRVCVCACLRV